MKIDRDLVPLQPTELQTVKKRMNRTSVSVSDPKEIDDLDDIRFSASPVRYHPAINYQ